MGFARDYLWSKLGGRLPDTYWRKVLAGGQPGGTYEIAYVQTGTGDPSPDNPRPILPGLTLIRDDASTLEVFGGELDAETGILTVTHRFTEFDGTESWSISWADTNPAIYTILSDNGLNNTGVFSHFSYANVFSTAGEGAKVYWQGSSYRFICRYDDQPATVADWKALLAEWKAAGTPLQAVYPLTEAETYQLTPAEVRRAVRALKQNH